MNNEYTLIKQLNVYQLLYKLNVEINTILSWHMNLRGKTDGVACWFRVPSLNINRHWVYYIQKFENPCIKLNAGTEVYN